MFRCDEPGWIGKCKSARLDHRRRGIQAKKLALYGRGSGPGRQPCALSRVGPTPCLMQRPAL
jgi:hypothetical protein